MGINICHTTIEKGIYYICYDGLYRIQACKVLKIETIPARIVNFKNMNEIIEAVFRANLTHGLRASMTTRSDYCYWLHITYPRLSQRDIATRVGIAQSTVSRAIEQRTKEQDTNKDTTMTRKQVAQEKEKQAQDFTKSTSKFLRLTTSFLNTVKREDYDDFVWNLQAELLNGPEDRQALLRVGQFLMDIAKARRKAKAPEPVGRK